VSAPPRASPTAASRRPGAFYSPSDIGVPPTPPRVWGPGGQYNLSRRLGDWSAVIEQLYKPPCQYTLPHNIMGTPAMSLPLAMHSTGVPIGVQIAAKPAAEHLLLQLAGALEEAMPWKARGPPPHAAKV